MFSNQKSLVRGFAYFTVIAVVLVLAGCQAAASTAPAGEAYPVDKPAVQPSEAPAGQAYPEPAGLPTSASPSTGEGGPGGGAPARPNASRIKAEIIEVKPAPDSPDYNLLHVKLLSSSAVEGKASVTDQLVNQEMDLLIKPADMPDLKAGNMIEAEVSFMGDEKGANYYILNVLKVSN